MTSNLRSPDQSLILLILLLDLKLGWSSDKQSLTAILPYRELIALDFYSNQFF
ncbi:hypothetical protein [Scytonema sp. NUACC26]|uniref:hypothetical protein n=1 Tax=Scytonema sp. NUACC26 TaxID=3140176 RepID=UPI0038B30726